MHPNELLRKIRDSLELLERPYFPPAVATLVAKQNVPLYRRKEQWEAPPGWPEAPSILDLPICPGWRPGIRVRGLGSCLAVHDPSTLDTHSLNETAVPIFLLSTGTRTTSDICDEYARIFELDAAEAKADVRRVLSELFEKNVLVPRRKDHLPKAGPEHSSPLPTLS